MGERGEGESVSDNDSEPGGEGGGRRRGCVGERGSIGGGIMMKWMSADKVGEGCMNLQDGRCGCVEGVANQQDGPLI